jgi:hypothetical protein
VKAARHDYLARVRVKLGTVERLYLDELVMTRDAGRPAGLHGYCPPSMPLSKRGAIASVSKCRSRT